MEKRKLEDADAPDAKRTKEDILEETKLLFERAKKILDEAEFDEDNALDDFATAADYLESIVAEDQWPDAAMKLEGQVLLLGALCNLIRGTEASLEEGSFLNKALPLVEALEQHEAEIADAATKAEAAYLRAFIWFSQAALQPSPALLARAAALVAEPPNAQAAILAADIERARGNLPLATQRLEPFTADPDAAAALAELDLEIAGEEGAEALRHASRAVELLRAGLGQLGEEEKAEREEAVKVAVETVAHLTLSHYRASSDLAGLSALESLVAATGHGWYDLACLCALAGRHEQCRSLLEKHSSELTAAAEDADLASVKDLPWFNWK